MSYSNSKVLAVRDSFDDDDASDDVEDEVFIRDGRNGSKVDEERGVKRPLMAPRRKVKSNQLHTEVLKSPPCKVFCAPCCYGCIALSTLLGCIVLVVLLILWLPSSLNRISFWKLGRSGNVDYELIPCTEFAVKDVWTKSLPKFTIESSIRLVDINNDAIPDIIIGYGTGTDEQNVPPVMCTIYFAVAAPCSGGVIALDGRTGALLWQHWMNHTVYWLDCGSDLTGDSVNDCLASGKSGVLCAVNGHDGSLLWQFRMPRSRGHAKLFDIYAGQFVSDMDGDGVVDILAAHTADGVSGNGFLGHLVLISGNRGTLLRMLGTPGGEEIYYAPQIIVRPDSQDVVLFGTGGQATPGGVYAMTLQQLILGDMTQMKVIHHDSKGVMSPPVLADVNGDGYEDIIVATFNSVVLAFDGITFQRLWNFTTPASETFSSPTPAYFNDDDVPDFLVKYQTGPGFPVYYYSQAAVLDGLTGLTVQKPLFESLASQSAGLTVSMEGFGNDLFLYWSGYCVGHEDATDAFTFPAEMSLSAQRKSDLCKLRFNTTQSYKLWALNQHIPPPGYAVYTSDSRRALEYNNSISPFLEAQQYMTAHPDFKNTYVQQQVSSSEYVQATEPPKEEPAMDINRKIFRHRDDQSLMGNANNHYHPDNSHRSDLYRGGEGEQMISGYLSDGKYPNVRKHGDMSTNHVHNNRLFPSHRPHQAWHENEEPNSYQDNPNGDANQDEKLYENPSREVDYDTRYEPRIVNGYIRQRDERSKTKGGTVGSGDNEEVLFKNYALPSELRRKPRVGARENAAQKEPSVDSGGEVRYATNQDVRSRTRSRVGESVVKREAMEPRVESTNVDGYLRQGDDRSKIMGGDTSRTVKREALPTVPGTQRLSSTGTLVPTLLGGKNSFDVIFATYWLPDTIDAPVAETFRECVRKKLVQSQVNNDKYFGMDADAAVAAGLGAECPQKDNQPTSDKGSDAAFDPTNISLGQMTVYRLQVTCTCTNLARKERCSKVLPFEEQSWPQFMGWNGKGYFKPRHK